MLKKIKTSSAAEEVIKQLLELIKEGVLKPGDKLPNEVELMKMMNVGRSTIREAKQVLAAKNYIASTPGRGTFIKEINFDEIVDEDVLDIVLSKENVLESIYETRQILEVETCVLAVKRATEEDLVAVKEAYESMKASKTKDEIFERGLNLHIKLVAASHNPVLVKMYFLIQRLLRKNQYNNYEVDVQKEIEIHHDLVKALLNRDAALMRKAAEEHFKYVLLKSNMSS